MDFAFRHCIVLPCVGRTERSVECCDRVVSVSHWNYVYF